MPPVELVTSLPADLEEKLGAHLREVFLETPYNVDHLRDETLAFCADHDHPFVLVSIPQDTEEMVTLSVQESRVGLVTVEGNRYFSRAQLEKSLECQTGSPVQPRALEQDLAWLNRNPFRSCDLILSPGPLEGQTNLELSVHDRLPFRPYAGSDNTGAETGNSIRLFAGFQWGNVLSLDHLLSYQLTTSPRPQELLAHTLSYLAPLPWRHLIHLYGSYTQVHVQHTPHLGTNGSSWQGSLRYQIPIRIHHELQFGGDYKATDNIHLFDTETVDRHTESIYQMEGRYSFTHLGTHFELELFAAPTYLYNRIALQHLFSLPYHCALDLLFRGQLATTTLFPTEQFGLGGADTVRGYSERLVNASNALAASVEFHGPTYRSLMPLLFSDIGYGNNIPLLSVGPGIRLSAPPYLSGRLDYGVRLLTAFDEMIGGGHLHFSATLSY